MSGSWLDAHGLGRPSPGSLIAPLLALVGLLVVALGTSVLLGGSVGVGGPRADGGPGGPAAPVVRTPAPSNVVIADPRPTLPGALVYAKAGNIWVQRANEVAQVTSSGTAAMPSWSPDGRTIVYVETTRERGRFPAQGRESAYEMDVPRVMRIAADGSGEPEVLIDGTYETERYRWFSWLRQPTVSPDGETIALVSDAPVPTESDVVLQLFDIASEDLTKPDLPQTAPLGHQDPAWRPDGQRILYTRNDRQGSRGTPVLAWLNLENGRHADLTSPGYTLPNYSPNGRHVVATKTNSIGTDVVILDASNGAELVRLTDDGRSWAPVWSPRGDQVAYLHIGEGIVDLRMIELEGTAPRWTPGEIVQLTYVSGLDPASRPDWFIPAEELPAPTPAPSSSPAASTGPSGAPG